jgi:3-oxoadipate enol-lactonase
MPIEQLNGANLYYESHGEGPAVVFLHGAGGNHISWWQQVPSFSQSYRCITIDHRGFGRSTDPDGSGSESYAADLEALLDHLGIASAALVAQSMGGRTASQFALAHPDRVWALVMSDTLGILSWADLTERRAVAREKNLAAAAEAGTLLRGYMAQSFITGNPEMTFLYGQAQALNPPRGETVPSDPLSHEQIAALAPPTLFIVGSEDPVVGPEFVREVRAVIEGSEMEEFPGAGHSVYWEQPDKYNPVLAAFLAKHA